MIQRLHHSAYRCRDSEETRAFYEDFLELPLAQCLELGETKTGRSCNVLHTFFRLENGAFLAFFEVPEMPFEFIDQHDFDLHIALKVGRSHMVSLFEKAQNLGLEVRGVVDHGIFESVYFRDPNGYVIELTSEQEDPAFNPTKAAEARASLDRWQASKN